MGLVLKEDLRSFADLVLDVLEEDFPRREELQALQATTFLSKMILDEIKSGVLWDPKISLLALDDVESSLGWVNYGEVMRKKSD